MRGFNGVVAVLAVAIIGVLAAGCGSGEASGLVKADKSAAGSTVAMKVGQTLEVALEGNPSTGYEWTVATPAGGILKQVGTTEFKAQSTLVGASGTYLFRFKAERKGEEELTFTYKRSWETTPQDEKLTITASVR